jgi:hypothetical protein
VDDDLSTRDNILAMVKKMLLKAQATMKEYANQKRSPHSFKVGDFVYVKLRPYRQISVGKTGSHKLTKRFIGPFKIIQQIDDVAFKLELPATSRIHPVFHTSKLNPCRGSTDSGLQLPPDNVDNMPAVQPLAVLDWKVTAGNRLILVQWEGLFPEDATCEDFEEMLKTYPSLHLEDKVCFDDPRDVVIQPNYEEGLNEEGMNETVPEIRPKRNTTRPKWLKDFVVPTMKKQPPNEKA